MGLDRRSLLPNLAVLGRTAVEDVFGERFITGLLMSMKVSSWVLSPETATMNIAYFDLTLLYVDRDLF